MPPHPRLSALREFLPYLWPTDNTPIRRHVVMACFFLLLAKLSSPLVPFLFKLSVDALAPSSSVSSFVLVPSVLIIAYGICRVLSLAFSELQNALFAKVGQNAVRRIGQKVFVHLHTLSLNFHLSRKTGGLSRAIERGTKAIENLLSFSLFNIIPTVLEIVGASILLWVLYGVTFAAVTFITMAVYVGITLLVTHWRMALLKRMHASEDRANTTAIDSLLNYETIKYFNNEEREIKRFDEAIAQYEKDSVRNKVSLSFLNISQSTVIATGLICVMLIASHRVAQGMLTIGDFVLVNVYLIQLYIPLNMLGFAYREIRQALITMEELFSLLHEKSDIHEAKNAPTLMLKGGEITFEHVSFSYHPKRPILQDISFTIPAGHTVAVVGGSGSGKTTLSRLLYRFYDPHEGRILIDNQDIKEVTFESLRHAIAVIPQDIVLFNETLFYNLSYGKPTATKDEVIAAAKRARLHDFVKRLPLGYDTHVGERGLKLSGGEKQRVAIARALLKNPAIYLLDEATSALDSHTERAIQENLLSATRGKTTLIIAHRLSTIAHADNILVINHGSLQEQGTHEELLRKKGLYASLWQRQQREAGEP